MIQPGKHPSLSVQRGTGSKLNGVSFKLQSNRLTAASFCQKVCFGRVHRGSVSTNAQALSFQRTDLPVVGRDRLSRSMTGR